MYQYELYIPTEFTSEIQYAIDSFAIYYGGATSYETNGLWRDDDGLPHSEPVTVVRSISFTPNDFPTRQMARYIKTTCNQQAVLWTKQNIQPTFEE